MPPKSILAGSNRPAPPVKKPTNSPVAVSNAANWNKPGGGYEQFKKGDPAREKAMPIGTILPRQMASPMAYKKGGKVKKTGLAMVHKGEKVVPAKKGKTKKILQSVGKELKTNPPSVLAQTAKKSGAKQANKQRVAILLSKARKAGAKIARPRNYADGGEVQETGVAVVHSGETITAAKPAPKKPTVAQDRRTIKSLRKQGDPDTDPPRKDMFVPNKSGTLWTRGRNVT